MDKKGLSTALQELAASDQRPQAAKLRDIFPDVDAALKAGVPRETVHQLLIDQGFTFTLRGFDQAMYRIRQKKQPANKSAIPVASMPAEAAQELTLEQAKDPANREQKFNSYFQKSNPLRSKK